MDLATVTGLDKKLRLAKRYQHILSVLIRHGFSELLEESGFRMWATKEYEIQNIDDRHHEQSSRKYLQDSRETRLRRVIQELGPTFIKMGQILSTRPDLIPKPLTDELKKLQANVPPDSEDIIKAFLEEEYGRELNETFSEIDYKAFAAASLAQAHRAVLKNGTRVVLKILRPGTRQSIEADSTIMMTLANFLEPRFAGSSISPKDIAKRFSEELQREVDLLNEGRNTQRLQAAFAGDEYIGFPRVYLPESTRNVLVLDESKGTLLSEVDISKLKKKDRRAIVEHGTRAVFHQCFELGFFHADPHPGNIFIDKNNRITFIDCGMTGRLDRATTERLAFLAHGIVTSNVDSVIDALIELTESERQIFRNRVIRNDVWNFISRFQHSSLESLDIGELLNSFFVMLGSHNIKCPSDIVFLIKAVTTIEGVAEEIDPDFDIVRYVRPYVESFVSRSYGPKAITRRSLRALKLYAELIEDLPVELKDLFDRVRNGRFQIDLHHQGITHLTETFDRVGTSISLSLIASAVLVGSSILILADKVSGNENTGVLTILGIIGFILSLIMGGVIFLTGTIFRRDK